MTAARGEEATLPGPTVEIRLLGGLAVVVDGAPAELPGRKVQALLARLARAPGVEIPRATLAFLLWPDRGDAQGRGSLRQALATLRRVLGPEAVRAGADAVALDPARVGVDLLADPPPLGLFLAGFPPVEEPFDDWVHAERAALAARALERCAAELAARAAAADPGCLALAEEALALDPTFEPAYRARMTVLAARGDRAGALREYARCRDALARAVGVAPSAETEALRRALAEDAAAAPAAGAGLRAVAVAPFEVNADGDAAARFARGLADEVRLELGRFRSLRVLDARPADLAGAQAAGAGWLLRAVVRGAGGRLRVSAHLVEVATGREAWGDRLDADLADVLGVEERLARAVASALAQRIDADALADGRRRPPDALDAYGLWLAGMDALRQGSRASDLEARRLFARALALDPSFARAHAGLSLSHFNDWSCAAWERWEENAAAAYHHALEATRLDPRDHLAHCILARMLLYRREFGRAETHLRRSLALNPNDPDVLAHLAVGFAYLGAPEEGIAAGEAARRLNPVHPDFYLACLAVNYLLASRLAEGIGLLERAPDAFVDTRAFLAAGAAHAGDLAAAREHARRFLVRFQRDIAPGAAPDAAVAWVLHVNPLRRARDAEWVVGGLAAAGIEAAGAAAAPP